MRILLVDNYDSFTYNLFQYLAELTGTPPVVYYNDQLTWREFENQSPDAVVISPGPGDPRNKGDFGICGQIIQKTRVPLLGVCLGHQGIGSGFGAKISYAPEVMHGRTSKIYHTGTGLFRDLPQGFEAVRYHSLVIIDKGLPQTLLVTARTQDGVIMGIQHVNKPVFGVQFHPESIGTEYGKALLVNFLQSV